MAYDSGRLANQFGEMSLESREERPYRQERYNSPPRRYQEDYRERYERSPSHAADYSDSYEARRDGGPPPRSSEPIYSPPPGKPPLPKGWIPQYDRKYQRWYYADETTGRTQWEAPGQQQGMDSRGWSTAGTPVPTNYESEEYRGRDYEEKKKKDHTLLAAAGGVAAGAIGGALLAHALDDDSSDEERRREQEEQRYEDEERYGYEDRRNYTPEPEYRTEGGYVSGSDGEDRDEIREEYYEEEYDEDYDD
ncbi:hypothetical protein F5Y16DRAFT_6517 [Xylariaceae sp. FL0255]|nr:hypothetical protein F5Y16DRAFT_6517 [Xylariaceae sp. FL0255]